MVLIRIRRRDELVAFAGAVNEIRGRNNASGGRSDKVAAKVAKKKQSLIHDDSGDHDLSGSF
jgi:hypothetical protein